VPRLVGDRDQDAIARDVPRVSLTCLKRSRSIIITVRYGSAASTDALISSRAER
jgi:hypothetical protein